MTRILYLVATAAFFAGIGAFWAIGLNESPAAAPAASGYTLAEVAKHNRADDCWMAIRGQVYDLTSYLSQHPTAPQVIVPACGTEATHAYETKNVGRPHSPYADELLKKYRIGALNS